MPSQHFVFSSKELRVLHVAGCGLVSNFLLDRLSTVAKCERSALSRLTSLVYLSYEDEPAVQSCEGRLLADTLQGEQDILVGHINMKAFPNHLWSLVSSKFTKI